MKHIVFTAFKKMTLSLSGSGLGKIPYAMQIYNTVHKHITPKYVQLGSIKYQLDKGDSLGLSIFGVNDRAQLKLINKVIKKNWHVVDVGAHIGYYSMQYAHLVGKNGKVFSFEPSRETYNTLVSNKNLNNFENIVTNNNIVSDHIKKIKFYLSGNPLTNRIANEHVKGKYYYIQSVTLDDYFHSDPDPINFVKIDVEGAEFGVLNGMKNLLKKNPNICLLIEFCPAHLEEYDTDPNEFLDSLMKNGFLFYDVSDKKQHISLISKEELISEYKYSITNIFCVRKRYANL